MIPETLDGWNPEAVRSLLRLGIAEDERFDWKAMVPPAADESGKMRIKEALAAFANGDGGFLVFGVSDDARLDADARLVGVDKPDVELGRLNEYAAACDPPVRWMPRTPYATLDTGRVLLVVQVPRSDRRPHRVNDKERSSFPLRTHGGTRQMTMIELRVQFADQSRRRRMLTFAISEAERVVVHGNDLNLAIQGQGGSMIERSIDWWMTRYDPHGLVAVLPDIVELVDSTTLEHAHTVVRDARASDRICEHVARNRTFTAPDVLDRTHAPMIAKHALRVMSSGKLFADRLKALLA